MRTAHKSELRVEGVGSWRTSQPEDAAFQDLMLASLACGIHSNIIKADELHMSAVPSSGWNQNSLTVCHSPYTDNIIVVIIIIIII